MKRSPFSAFAAQWLTRSHHSRNGASWRNGAWQFLATFLVVLATTATSAEAQSSPESTAPEPVNNQAPLLWAADAEGGAPYIFYDPADPSRIIGYEYEMIQLLAREVGRPIEFKQYGFESLVSGLKRGDFHFVMNGLEVTPARERELRLSRPYYRCPLQLVVRADDDRFTDLESVRAQGGVVASLGETRAAWLLKDRGIRSRIYDAPLEPYTELEVGRVDAVLLDLPIANFYAKPKPSLKLLGPPISPGYYVIAFRKEDELLAQQFDAAILRLGRSGELQELLERWELWSDDQSLLFGDEPPPPLEAVGVTDQASVDQYLNLLVTAAWLTIKISVSSMALAMVIGLPVALCRLYGPRPLQFMALSYVEFFRGIPVLILLYFIYYGLATISKDTAWSWLFNLHPFFASVVALGINYAAYEAEIYRAGLMSIPAGQWEAAASLGMSSFTTFRRIILPQALRIIVPPVTNDFVALFKDTSLVSMIGMIELSKQYQLTAKSNGRYFEVGIVTALLYLVMSVPLSYLARWLEKRWQ